MRWLSFFHIICAVVCWKGCCGQVLREEPSSGLLERALLLFSWIVPGETFPLLWQGGPLLMFMAHSIFFLAIDGLWRQARENCWTVPSLCYWKVLSSQSSVFFFQVKTRPILAEKGWKEWSLVCSIITLSFRGTPNLTPLWSQLSCDARLSFLLHWTLELHQKAPNCFYLWFSTSHVLEATFLYQMFWWVIISQHNQQF